MNYKHYGVMILVIAAAYWAGTKYGPIWNQLGG